MAYNQMLQSTVEGVKSIARTDLCLMDTEGNVIAATNEEAQQFRDISILKSWTVQRLNM